MGRFKGEGENGRRRRGGRLKILRPARGKTGPCHPTIWPGPRGAHPKLDSGWFKVRGCKGTQEAGHHMGEPVTPLEDWTDTPTARRLFSEQRQAIAAERLRISIQERLNRHRKDLIVTQPD